MAISSVQRLKLFLGMKDTDVSQDEKLKLFLAAAQDVVEQYCGRKFEKATYRETISGLGGYEVSTYQYPIISIEEIRISNDRSFHPISLLAYGEYGVSDAGTSITTYGVPFSRGSNNIQYVYTAGYEEVPPAIELAVLWCAEWYYRMSQRQDVGRSSIGKAGESVSILQSMPAMILETLQNYKRYEVPGNLNSSVRIA